MVNGLKIRTFFSFCSQKNHRLRLTKTFSIKILIVSYPSNLTYVLGAQKNRLIETVLLSIHNICFG